MILLIRKPFNQDFRVFQYKKRILGECILVSSLSGSAKRTLVELHGSAEQFNMQSRSRVW